MSISTSEEDTKTSSHRESSQTSTDGTSDEFIDPPRKWSYYLVKHGIFSAALYVHFPIHTSNLIHTTLIYQLQLNFVILLFHCRSIFYNDIEIVGRSKFPRSGPVIVALNHANSLVDAAVALTSFPRNVRLTCKDTLLEHPLWGRIIQGVEAIGVKRRRDYGGAKCDNSQAFSKLFYEIDKGCCVGMFPEGIGRYKSSLSPLKTGLARTAVDFVVQQCTKLRFVCLFFDFFYFCFKESLC